MTEAIGFTVDTPTAAIEDLGTSYFVEYGGQELRHPDTAVDYVKDLADAVQRDQAVRPPDGVRSAVGPIALDGLVSLWQATPSL